MDRNIIRCSQCEETFPGGFEYRMHWEKHLNEFLKTKNEREEFNRDAKKD
jgi:hypothetical protein